MFVSIGSAPSLAPQTTMKNQDKKNGAAKQSGNTSNAKSNPGQAEAGPEGAQGRPSQSAPATEAEGSSSQAPGKTEGVCQLCFPAGRGRSLWCARVASGVRGLGRCLCHPPPHPQIRTASRSGEGGGVIAPPTVCTGTELLREGSGRIRSGAAKEDTQPANPG